MPAAAEREIDEFGPVDPRPHPVSHHARQSGDDACMLVQEPACGVTQALLPVDHLMEHVPPLAAG